MPRVSVVKINPGMYFKMMKEDPDIIHSIGVRSFQSYIAALVSKRKNIPMIISDQGGLTTHPTLTQSSIVKRLLYKIQLPMIRFIINQAAVVIAANEYEKEIFSKLCTDSKISIVRNGVNLENLSSQINFKKKYNIKEDFIFFLGRFHEVKGIDVLLNAINQIKNSPEMSNIKLIIMGVDFGYESQMIKMIDQLQINNKVTVIKNPPREDVIAAYKESRFLVLPSRWELSPLTPLEGFVFKKPVISTNVHGIPYTIKHQHHGLLVNSEDYHALSKAILELLSDVKKCEEYGKAGFEMVKEICNSKTMAVNTLKIYEKIVNR